jgi:hypothetical protein
VASRFSGINFSQHKNYVGLHTERISGTELGTGTSGVMRRAMTSFLRSSKNDFAQTKN